MLFLTCLLRDFPIWAIKNAENLFCFFYCLMMWMEWGNTIAGSKIYQQFLLRHDITSCTRISVLCSWCPSKPWKQLKVFTHNVYISGGSILESGSCYRRFLTKVLVLRTNSIKSVHYEKRVATIYFLYRIFEIFVMH